MADRPFDYVNNMDNNRNNTTDSTTSAVERIVADIQSEQLRHLRSIDRNVAEMLKRGVPMSQGAAKDAAYEDIGPDSGNRYKSGKRSSRTDPFKRPSGVKKGQRFRHDGRDDSPPDYAKGNGKDHESRWEKEVKSFNDMLGRTYTQFFDEFEDSVLDQIGFFDLAGGVKASLTRMADTLGVSLEDVGPELGRMAAKDLAGRFAQTKMGQGLANSVKGKFEKINSAFSSMADSLYRDVVKDSKDAARVQVNRQAREADDAEDLFSKADERARKGQWSFDDHMRGGANTWDKIKSAMFQDPGVAQHTARSQQADDSSYADTPSGQPVGQSSLNISTSGAIRITANSVILEGMQSSADRNQQIIDTDYEFVDDSVSTPDIDTSQLSTEFADKAGDIADIVGDAMSKGKGGKGEILSKGLEIVSKGQGSAGSALGQAGGKIAGLLGSGSGGAAAAGSGAAAAGGASTALATTGSAAAAGGGAMAAAGGTAAVGGAAAAGGGAMAAGSGMLAAAGPYGWIALVVIAVAKPLLEAVLGSIMNAFADVSEKWGELKEDVGDAFNRSKKSAEKNVELSQQRLEDDVEALIREPFEILKDAAQEVYNAWDSNLREINGTQGYTKDDLQSLMGAYAARLRSEGLSSAIGATDITENMTKVLGAGLSGTIAEEFAYIATKLGAAIPTQDFFSYASTYAQVASQAVQSGLSQSEAIARANQELETFASGLLYASRELTGGFTTGLTDGSALYQQAAQIAQAAQSDNVSQIASVLTSVSAIGGSVAPDLTSGLIDAVYKAAVGGNDSSIVALRSLAGINASNTEFLRQLAKNPQKVFADMFEGLGQMQTMSKDNYMEVAEALSDTFGVSMDALARVDFQYLAQNIRNMETSTDALNQNVAHLASGETTTYAEALRMQQINEYMIDEGLAYVLDNQVARSIQEHMWDEQIARELMEAQYAVELQGSALQFLQSIMSAVDTIMTILNPFRLFSKIGDLIATAAQGKALEADIAQTLLLGRVGKGQASDLYNLTTRNADLNLTPSYVALQGGLSSYEMIDNFLDLKNSIPGIGGNFVGTNGLQAAISKGLMNLGQAAASSIFSGDRGGGSVYTWGKLSKSGAAAITGTKYATSLSSGSGSAATPSGVSASSASAQSAATSRLMELLDSDYLKTNFIDKEKGYDDWVLAAKAAGFADVEKALAEAGMSTQDVQGQFNKMAGQRGSEIAGEDEEQKRRVWTMLEEKLPAMEELLIAQNEHQTWLQEHLTEVYAWMKGDVYKWMKDDAHPAVLARWDMMQRAVGDPQKESIQDILGFTAKDNVRYLLQLIQDALTNEEYGIMKAINDFKKEMVDYFVKHVVYNQSLNGSDDSTTSWYSKVQEIQRKEKDEASSAIYTLADALTSNMVDLRDPQVQTNALLAQILKLVEVITTQNASAGGGQSIADSLIGMALGYVSNTG